MNLIRDPNITYEMRSLTLIKRKIKSKWFDTLIITHRLIDNQRLEKLAINCWLLSPIWNLIEMIISDSVQIQWTEPHTSRHGLWSSQNTGDRREMVICRWSMSMNDNIDNELSSNKQINGFRYTFHSRIHRSDRVRKQLIAFGFVGCWASLWKWKKSK